MAALSTDTIERQLTNQRWLVALTLVLAAACAGCGISPKPQPPIPGSGFDFGQVITHETGTFGPKAIEGGPGAASPAGAVVRAVNLELPEDPVDGIIADDGSFEVELTLLEGNEVRLQIIDGDDRSEPIDVVVGPDDTSPTLAWRALDDCLSLTPPLEIDSSVAQTIELHNGCGEVVTLIEPYLRRPVTGLTVGTGGTWPTQVDGDSAISVPVQFQAPTGTLEEVVFIEVTAPAADRRPITVLPTP
ncbi:MAG: hypothetical protein DRI90_02110 [Deltaproteobacteria bacterium]|nr:MAG: hypothetical protein DRI90_02110 [Deltaproteobacteria bacterium]